MCSQKDKSTVSTAKQTGLMNANPNVGMSNQNILKQHITDCD